MKFPEYKLGADPSVYDQNLQRSNFDMLQTEAPLSEEWLLKRIAYYFGREKVTSAVWDDYDQWMRGCENLGIIRRNGFLYLKGKNPYMMRVPGDFKRDIKYISLEELAGGIYAIVDQNVTASKEGVYSTLCSQLCFSRCGDSIKARLDEALKLLGRNINVNGDILSVNK